MDFSAQEILDLIEEIKREPDQEAESNDLQVLFEYFKNQASETEKLNHDIADLQKSISNQNEIRKGISLDDFDGDSIQGNLLTLERSKTTVETDIRTLRSEIGQLNGTDNSNADTKNELKSQLSQLEQECKQLEEQAIQLNSVYQIKQESVQVCHQDISNFNEQMDKANQETQSLAAKLSQNNENISQIISEFKPSTAYQCIKSKSLTKPLNGIQFPIHHQAFITSSVNKEMKSRDPTDLKTKATYKLLAIPNSIHLYSQNDLLAVSCANNRTYIIDVLLKVRCTLDGHIDEVLDNCWLSNNRLATSSKDRTIQFFDVSSSRKINSIPVPSAANILCPIRDVFTFLTATSDGGLSLIDSRSAVNGVATTSFPDLKFSALVPNFYGNKIYALLQDGTKIYEIDANTLNLLNTYGDDDFPAAHDKMTCLSIDCVNSYIGAGTHSGRIALFDINNHNQAPVILESSSKKPIECLSFGPNMLIATDSKNIHKWG